MTREEILVNLDRKITQKWVLTHDHSHCLGNVFVEDVEEEDDTFLICLMSAQITTLLC